MWKSFKWGAGVGLSSGLVVSLIQYIRAHRMVSGQQIHAELKHISKERLERVISADATFNDFQHGDINKDGVVQFRERVVKGVLFASIAVPGVVLGTLAGGMTGAVVMMLNKTAKKDEAETDS